MISTYKKLIIDILADVEKQETEELKINKLREYVKKDKVLLDIIQFFYDENVELHDFEFPKIKAYIHHPELSRTNIRGVYRLFYIFKKTHKSSEKLLVNTFLNIAECLSNEEIELFKFAYKQRRFQYAGWSLSFIKKCFPDLIKDINT